MNQEKFNKVLAVAFMIMMGVAVLCSMVFGVYKQYFGEHISWVGNGIETWERGTDGQK